MLKITRQQLPTSAELPDSDDTPVDNEDQNFLPNFLLFLLETLWSDRDDWYFAVDMGVYHTTGLNPRIPVIPDGFLSLGVERRKGGKSRGSYVTWEEQDIVPILVLEVVSHTYGKEYDQKLEIYRRLGVLYYVIYNPHFCQRDRHEPFEVYKLIDGNYKLQSGEPFWMPEIGLGIGRCVLPTDRYQRELLSWFDQGGDRYLSSEERLNIERQRADIERQRAAATQEQMELLLARMRSLGLEPEEFL
ncbi:MAG: Uma2 family endonuclease [Coleofasciculaceae cyanobacterium SM2_1_6]|nr:Uma2 family endonuclease [Coleofasciculaceae cyanobacterium SM2_1_6]